MHSSCLATPGKILWQYPISSVLWLACQGPVTSMPFRATDDCSFQSLLSSFCPLILHHNPLSYTCSFILPLFHLPVPSLLLFTSLFSTSPPQLPSQPFQDHSFFTVLDSGLFCSLFLLLVIILNLFLLGLVLSLLLFSSSSCMLLIAPLVGSFFLVIFCLGLFNSFVWGL